MQCMKDTLNKAQREAVEYTDGPLLIVAGAGTGKTTVISQKIIHIIDTKLAKPEEILALTFTDKAAGEMEERVDKLLDIGYTDMQISTFHAFCQRVLEKYGIDAGISNQFKLLTQTDTWLLVRENLNKLNLDYYRPIGNPVKHIHELIKHFSKCKDELITPEEYLDYAKDVKIDENIDEDEKNRLIEIAGAYEAYNKILLNNNSFDFSDLIFYTVKLLEKRPNILKALQNQFKYILVDEFQDVNWSQYKLVQLLSARNNNLTVVGDDDQSIYAFRGASVSNIMRFKDDYKGAKEIVLNENYRSGQTILDTSYNSIQNNNPDRLEVKLKIDKKLLSKTKTKGNVFHIHTRALEDEAQVVVQEILDLKKNDKEATWDDFAILVRANSNAEPFLQRLELAKIPYEFLASSGLYKQPVVMDCINFLKLLDNYHDSSAVYRLLRMPFLNFKEGDMQKFTIMSRRKSTPYIHALKRAKEFDLSDEGVGVCNKLIQLLANGMKKEKVESPTIVLYHFLEESGYLSYLAHEEAQANRAVIRQIYQLKQFLDYINKYEQTVPGAHVAGFIEHYEYLQEAGDDGKLYQAVDTPDSLNVMTIHASKGMEFKYVFMVNMVEQRFPARSRGDAIEIPLPLIKEQLPEGDSHYQEERRLFYVGITRAKEKLFFISADNYGGVRNRKLSRFLDELGYKAVDSENNIETKNILDKKEKNEEETKKEMVYTLPKTFSFSQIQSYENCPYQYKLANIIKLPAKNSPYFTFGNTIHNTLQEFYKRIQTLNNATQESLFSVSTTKDKSPKGTKVPSVKELIEIYDSKWSDDWYINKKQREDYYQEGIKLLNKFYKDNDEKWTIPIFLECGFKLKIGDYLLSGRIDRIDKLDDGTLEIIDYKTGASKEKIIGDDKNQLLIYQIVAETVPEYRNIGKTSKLTYYYVKDGIKTDFIGKPTEIEKLREKIEDTIDNIHQRNFEATPSKHVCGNCSFKDICEFRI